MATMTEQLVAICNAMGGLLREACGRGPSRCSAHWAGPDLLVVLLHGGFTAAEQTLCEGGGGAAVRASRLALKDVLEPRMTALVEGLTGREVTAFMSTSHQDPDYQLEAFVLASEGA